MSEAPNLKVLQSLIKLANDENLSRSDFTNAFKKVIEVIKQQEGKREVKMQQLAENVLKAREELKNQNDAQSKSTLTKLENELERIKSENTKDRASILKKLAEVKDGIDADEDTVVDRAVTRVKEELYLPTTEDLLNGVAAFGERVRDALEAIPEEEDKLSIEAIKDLRKTLDELRKLASSNGGAGASIAKYLYQNIDVDTSGATNGQVLSYQASTGTWVPANAGAGTGDMLASVYDPQAIAADAFDTDNHTSGTTNKVYTATEQTKLAGIEALADVTDTTNVDAAGATMNTDTDLSSNGYFLDEDDFASNDATKVASQQSIKVYVDNAIASSEGILTYVFSSVNSDIATYESMPSLPSYTAGALTTLPTVVSTSATLMGVFATDVGFPNTTAIPAGTFTVHFDTDKVAGSNNYYCYAEIYKRSSGGTETLLTTTDNSTQTAVNTVVSQTVTALLSTNTTLVSTDRIVVKIYGVLLSASATVNLLYDDTTNARLEMPASHVDATNFVPYTGATTDLNLGTHSVTATGVTDSSLTASELVASDGSKALQSLAVATYPSLAEVAHVKGVTSAIQTQIDAKEPTLVGSTITGKTTVTAVGTDYVLISDTSDSGNLKKALASDLGSGGTNTYFNDMYIDQSSGTHSYGNLSGTINGSNTTFTVSQGAYLSGSLEVELQGQGQMQDASFDWVETTPASGTFDFVVAPPTGSIIKVRYQVQSLSSNTVVVKETNFKTKAITVESPTSTEDITMFFTDDAITITQMNAVLANGSSTPSVTWTIRHGTDRSGTGAEVVTSGTTTTSISTGSEVTSFNDATIVAGSWVWLETTAQSGTVPELNVTVEYTID